MTNKTRGKVETNLSTNIVKSRNTFPNILKTICLVVVWICMGSYMEINGPTLKDLVYRVGGDYDSVTGAITGRSVGKFFGSVIGGVLTDTFGSYSDLIIAISSGIAACTVAGLPWITNTDALWFIYFTLGVCLGATNIAGNRLILVIWMEQAASPLHLLHLGYGVGGFLAPLIANPFLADFKTINKGVKTRYMNQTYETSTLETNVSLIKQSFDNTTTNVQVVKESQIQYAYGIVAVMTMSISIVFIMHQCVTSNTKSRNDGGNADDEVNKKRSWKKMINPATCADGNFLYGLAILVLLFIRYFFYTGCDRNIGTFVRSYAVDQLDFSKDDGSYINTVYWATYAVGRLVCFVVANCISVKVLFLGESLCAMLVALGICVFSRHIKLSYWILIGLLGFFVGPMFPSGMAWGDLHIDMTGLAITWVMLGSAFGGLTFIKLGGYTYDEYGPTAFVYLVFGLALSTLVLDVVLTFFSFCRQRCSTTNYVLSDRELEVEQNHEQIHIRGESIALQQKTT